MTRPVSIVLLVIQNHKGSSLAFGTTMEPIASTCYSLENNCWHCHSLAFQWECWVCNWTSTSLRNRYPRDLERNQYLMEVLFQPRPRKRRARASISFTVPHWTFLSLSGRFHMFLMETASLNFTTSSNSSGSGLRAMLEGSRGENKSSIKQALSQSFRLW